ncbi:MAG: hypothetical protein IKT20_00375 [Clostridiales bacterium]|nr:hypothetical protein [Clostridiales bacterium]
MSIKQQKSKVLLIVRLPVSEDNETVGPKLEDGCVTVGKGLDHSVYKAGIIDKQGV